jgi:predicted membrane chloride channel (bestrophin family)
MRSLPRSSVLRDILNPVIAVVAWGTFVSVAQRVMAFSNHECFRMLANNMCISATAHGFLVSALGLLLVFRTNSAYQRFYVRCFYVQ